MPDYHEKDPAAVLDYRWDWTTWLAQGETITTADVDVTPAGLTIADDPAVAHDAHTVTAWLEGGAVNTDYVVTCHMTTSQGRTDDRSKRIRVTNR